MLDLYKVSRMVEDEIAEMKKRQQTVLSVYQQQTREDIVKKFVEADHLLLEAAEQKVKEINELRHDKPYLVTSARKVVYLSVRRVKDESDLTVEIDPIIYPTSFNLKFILNEPSIGLYSPSSVQGIISFNIHTPIRATDMVQTLEVGDLESFADLWITHKADEGFVRKLRTVTGKITHMNDSAEMLLETMLAMSSPTPPRSLIYSCEEHEKDPTHKHERTVPPSAVKGLLKHHLKL